MGKQKEPEVLTGYLRLRPNTRRYDEQMLRYDTWELHRIKQLKARAEAYRQVNLGSFSNHEEVAIPPLTIEVPE